MGNAPKKFRFPDKLLRELDECSYGGFVLFNFNVDGDPEVHSNFDDSVNAMALQQYVRNWNNAVESVNLEMTVDALMRNHNRRDREDKEDEEE